MRQERAEVMMQRMARVWYRGVLASGQGFFVLLVVLVLRGFAGPVPKPFSAAYYSSDSQRFGVGLNRGTSVTVGGQTRPALITDYAVDDLHVGWYSDWRANPEPLRPFGIRYAPMIGVRAGVYPTDTAGLADTVRLNPGSLWLVGNEPEAKYGQGNRTPEEYAEIYHDVYALIKTTDPSAWIAIGGVIQPTPLRLKWLDRVLQEYQRRYGLVMPVDVWNVHMQILNEKVGDWGAGIPAGLTETEGRLYGFADNASPDEFRRLVHEFRQWMKDRGQQNKPLIISEYGVLLPSYYLADTEQQGDQMVINFMRQTFDYMLTARDPELGYPADGNRLVQQWLWYSLNDQPYDPDTGKGFNGSLFSNQYPSQLTVFGQAFQSYLDALSGTVMHSPVVGSVAD
jgi:hypothetical protein